MQAMNDSYPATFSFDPPEKVANWRPLVQWILAIPHFIVLYVIQIVVNVVVIIAWFAILFTGKMPEGLANIEIMYIRYAARTYTYLGYLREEYPPFTFETTPGDPGDDPRVRVDIQPQLEGRNRLTVFFRIFLVIPQMIVLAVLSIGAYFVYLIAFFAVLFTGKWPTGMRDYVVKVLRWAVRLQAYYLLLTDVYPPFTLD
jgi:Domain of unknown function (DUF4389)